MNNGYNGRGQSCYHYIQRVSYPINFCGHVSETAIQQLLLCITNLETRKINILIIPNNQEPPGFFIDSFIIDVNSLSM